VWIRVFRYVFITRTWGLQFMKLSRSWLWCLMLANMFDCWGTRALTPSTRSVLAATHFVEIRLQMQALVLVQLDSKCWWIYKKQHPKLVATLQLPRHKWQAVQSMPLHNVMKLSHRPIVWIVWQMNRAARKVIFPIQMVGHFDPPRCFMRYSETPFFADNQTMDISPFNIDVDLNE